MFTFIFMFQMTGGHGPGRVHTDVRGTPSHIATSREETSNNNEPRTNGNNRQRRNRHARPSPSLPIISATFPIHVQLPTPSFKVDFIWMREECLTSTQTRNTYPPQDQPINLASAVRVSIDTAVQTCEVRKSVGMARAHELTNVDLLHC